MTSGPATSGFGPAPSAASAPQAPGVESVRLTWRTEHGRRWPALVWAPGEDWRMISSAILGGGIGERRWWLNTQVVRDYSRLDPQVHLAELAAALGLQGAGVGLLTAADVLYRTSAVDGGVLAVATVGLGLPVLAAAPDSVIAAETPLTPPPGTPPRRTLTPGTINVLAVVPVPLDDAALVNTVITATEAKTQALAEAGVPGTGTSSDAVCVACPLPGGFPDREPEIFGGPRSVWGARLARAVHRAVADGTAGWLQRHPDAGCRTHGAGSGHEREAGR